MSYQAVKSTSLATGAGISGTGVTGTPLIFAASGLPAATGAATNLVVATAAQPNGGLMTPATMVNAVLAAYTSGGTATTTTPLVSNDGKTYLLPADVKVSSAALNATTNVLTLTQSDSSTVTVDLTDLANVNVSTTGGIQGNGDTTALSLNVDALPAAAGTINNVVVSSATTPDGALATPAAVVAAVALNAWASPNTIQMFQNASGTLSRIDVGAPACNPTGRASVVLGYNGTTLGWYRTTERHAQRTLAVNGTLAPSTDDTIIITANAVTLTLAAPGTCDRNRFTIKYSNSTGSCTVTANAGSTIDGAASITLSASGAFATSGGESVDLEYVTATSNWIIV